MAESSTQKFLEIADIKEGVITLKNKSLRGILMVSSLNFALKSDEEQSAIIYAYQSFLNTLDFSCQIVIQSRNTNITPYLDELKEMENRQKNELLKTQIFSYRKFIKDLVKGDTIMTKNFYVIVPYTLMEAIGLKAIKKQFEFFKIFGKIFGKKQEEPTSDISDANFQRCKTQLWQRMEFVAIGLKRCGLNAIPLTTPEIVELFWSIHHPKEAEVGYYPEILPELLK